MATATLAWDNTAVLASGNATGQVASKRIKAVGGAFSTSGFSPANPLLTSAITTDATITPNRIYEFKVEATCVLGGPTINNNGLKEQIVSGGVVIQWSITNNGIDWANVGPAFASTTCQLRGTIAAIPAGSTLYLQIIAGPSNPVKFGDINGSSCPISSTGCLTSFLVNSNLSRAFTIKVLSSAVVSC